MYELIVRLHDGDERMLLYVISRRQEWLDRTARALTHLGGATATIALTSGLLLSPFDAWRHGGQRAAFALAASHAVVQLIKRSVCRGRPLLPEGILCLIDAPDRFSFPSGHAAAALSVSLGMAAAMPAAAPLFVPLGLLIGVTRCYLGVHYPGDVVAGWSLAAAAFLLGAAL